MGKLILMRHGQSEWNRRNLFTGWVDIPLSSDGIVEAIEGGREIQEEPVDIVFTSTLIRAQMTVMLALSIHKTGKVPVIIHEDEGKLGDWSQIHSHSTALDMIPVYRAWELNERMYGELQGMDKTELAEKYGAEQVRIWRRSFDIPPPGGGESLEMTAARTIPYFTRTILPHLQEGKNVFVVAHGNSLRSIIMYLDHLTPQEVLHLELPTGLPVIYEYQGTTFTKK